MCISWAIAAGISSRSWAISSGQARQIIGQGVARGVQAVSSGLASPSTWLRRGGSWRSTDVQVPLNARSTPSATSCEENHDKAEENPAGQAKQHRPGLHRHDDGQADNQAAGDNAWRVRRALSSCWPKWSSRLTSMSMRNFCRGGFCPADKSRGTLHHAQQSITVRRLFQQGDGGRSRISRTNGVRCSTI